MMINLKNITLFITVIGIAFYLPATKGAPTSISDDRIRSLNVVPVLGRGYSLGTNSFQSTCLMVDEVTTPSYNYDCKKLVLLLSFYCFKYSPLLICDYYTTDVVRNT